MINVEHYLTELTEKLNETFGQRLLYIGLQGSYLRGEATENSDIDVMVVLDTLSVSDLEAYRCAIMEVGHFELSCGFLCGRKELRHWSPLEIGHLLHTTKDIYGVLSDFTPKYLENDIRAYIKIGLCNLYHELCHRYVHAPDNRNLDDLTASYKSVFFILQNLFFLEHGQFMTAKNDLLLVLDSEDRTVLQRAIDLSHGEIFDFEETFEILFTWCQNTLGVV
jgi:predicted nucleotidyltransferase